MYEVILWSVYNILREEWSKARVVLGKDAAVIVIQDGERGIFGHFYWGFDNAHVLT